MMHMKSGAHLAAFQAPRGPHVERALGAEAPQRREALRLLRLEKHLHQAIFGRRLHHEAAVALPLALLLEAHQVHLGLDDLCRLIREGVEALVGGPTVRRQIRACVQGSSKAALEKASKVHTEPQKSMKKTEKAWKPMKFQ